MQIVLNALTIIKKPAAKFSMNQNRSTNKPCDIDWPHFITTYLGDFSQYVADSEFITASMKTPNQPNTPRLYFVFDPLVCLPPGSLWSDTGQIDFYTNYEIIVNTKWLFYDYKMSA